jgi:hypothetical protein
MKLELRDYLEAQKRAPFKETLVTGNKVCQVICKELTFRNKVYRGPNPRIWHSEGEQIELPAAEAKRLSRDCKVKLLGSGYNDGPWDHFLVTEKQIDGYRPWDSLPNDYPGVPHLEPTEFDSCWLPVRSRAGGLIIYLPFAIYQRLPLRGDPNWERSALFIELAGFESLSWHGMANA